MINKKASLDRIMKVDALTDAQVQRAKARTVTAIGRLLRIFPNLKTTRFHRLSDFYTLVFLIAQFAKPKGAS